MLVSPFCRWFLASSPSALMTAAASAEPPPSPAWKGLAGRYFGETGAERCSTRQGLFPEF